MKSSSKLAVLSFKAEPELVVAVQAFADENGQTVSAAIRQLVERALNGVTPTGGADAGYQDGLRRGLHEARTKIAGSLKGSW